MSNDIMLDIETMSVHPARALVLSFAAVPFNLNLLEGICGGTADNPAPAPTFHLGHRTWVLDVRQQLGWGRMVDAETQRWWADPERKTARECWSSEEGRRVGKVLTEFYELLGEWPDARLWANGVVFDVGNLHQLYLDAGLEVPWRYNQPRDARTIYDLPVLRERPKEQEAGVAHDPLWDCREQVWRLWERWPTMILEKHSGDRRNDVEQRG